MATQGSTAAPAIARAAGWAYYNDSGPKVCAWARELIKAGLVPDGEVDERSITDVAPEDVRGFRQCHFFCGILGWPYALRLAGWDEGRAVWTGSCPCQPFSAAGKGAGTSDPRHLWPAWFRLISACRPSVLFGEQVEAAIRHGWWDLVRGDLEGEGYACGMAVLGAHSVGAPHIRQRCWFVADASERGRQQVPLGASGDEAADGRAGWDWSEPDGDYEPASVGTDGRVADAQRDTRVSWRLAGESREGAGAEGPRPSVESGRCGDPDGLADPLPAGRPERRAISGNRSAPGGGGTGLGLGDPNPARPQGRSLSGPTGSRHRGGQRPAGPSGPDGPAGKLADALSLGAQRAGSSELLPDAGRSADPWADVIWLPCRDGKSRPTQPGIQPLATGVPARVALLRGIGNSISPQVAEAFIRAYLEC